MNALSLVYVACGGAVGAMLRYITIHWVARLSPTEFPIGTLTVNVVGSMLMGAWVAAVLTLPIFEKAKDLHLLLAVGMLGGFTTFSAFSMDAFTLATRGSYTQAAIYIAGSVGLSIGALLLGMLLVKWATS